jgi:DNA-binding CsgD family transcriptional regulator
MTYGRNENSIDRDLPAAAAILAAIRAASEHGGATAALGAAGIEIPDAKRFAGLGEEFRRLLDPSSSGDPLTEALALGFIAGRVAHKKRIRTQQDTTWFMMDRDLFVHAAEGESILRLPWFEEELFVGRQLPDVREIPARIRSLAVDSYRTALAGEHTQYTFTSYGHAYSVDAVPIRGDDGRIDFVMAVAIPGRSRESAATAYDRMARRFDHAAAVAEQRAKEYRLEGSSDAEASENRRAESARQAAERAKVNARLLRADDPTGGTAPPSLTPREVDVLALASHGLSYREIAEELVLTSATVKTHLANVYAKFHVCDKAGAVAAALRHGLIE